ncbi:circadian-associated transcriptional repressor-like [Antennarius striatus]|uniref:circadian-associated transcriptional repressor-like n=1 Tax=Antennarius striatus TaxID=241820 RepID=UPI0035AE8889
MSTSDSDYSIDWLASDEDDCNSPKRLSPQHVEDPLAPASSSSLSSSSSLESSLRESPTSCSHCGTPPRMRRSCGCEADADSPAVLQTPTVGPVQGFDSRQTLSRESKLRSTRKRAHSAGWNGLCGKPQADTENEVCSQKCLELQCYIQPLSSILRGLRSGRYSERLSSFQESVAMDRIQRIMGVLQNPNMGGRFLRIILTIEKMLQSWFPHIKPALTQRDNSTPVKKQKHHSSAFPPPSSLVWLCSSDVERYASTHLKWLHTSPICSLRTPDPSLSRCAASTSQLEATQDNAVSSSTDLRTRPPWPLGANAGLTQGPPPFKISSPCLERLLQAKESIIAPRTEGDGECLEGGRFVY